jgi:HEAT repeat protein
MADSTLKQLTQLVRAADSPELRRAAILVAGAVGSAGERNLVQALLDSLEADDPDTRVAAVNALGQLHADEALQRLVQLVLKGGPELEPAVRAASLLGKRGARAVGQALADAHPFLRSRIAAALPKADTEGAVLVTAQALLDKDPHVVQAAARSLVAEVPALGPPQRRALAGFLVDALKAKRGTPSAESEAAVVRVLGALHEPKAEDLFWARLAPPTPTPVRVAALHALGHEALPSTDAKLQRLLACAMDSDFQVVAPALLLLQNVPLGRKDLKPWLALLEAPDVGTRRFAVVKLKDADSPDLARALLGQLGHPDRALHDEALAALRASPAGRKALLDRLLAAPTPESAWDLARSVAPSAGELADVDRKRLFAQACKYTDSDDRRADALWFLLRQADPGWARDQVEQRALALRKKKDYPGALTYFRLLTRDPACSEDVRFEAAATGLKESPRDLSPDARHADPVLGNFARLLQDLSFDVAGRLAKAKWLGPEDLFYLGFHFAEQDRRAKEFGKQVLEMAIARSPRSELAKNARRKLKTEALA